jgi:carboxypeptidase Taq
MDEKFERLKSLLARIDDLSSAADVLEWDQETYMPEGASETRAHQIATLRKLAHEYFTSDEIGRLLEELLPLADNGDPLSNEAAIVRVTRRDYDKALRLPPELVGELARSVARARQAWKTARATNDFSVFAPHLGKVVELNIQKAEALGYDDRIYDALLDQFEPGMKTAEVERVFGSLRAELVPIVQALAEREAPDDAFLHMHYDRQKQWDFGVDVIRQIGYDFNRGRQDISAHPFTTSFSINDVRITTRIREDYFPSAFFSTLHEAGHALYEQGISPELERTPLADGTSLGIHESQSRLWENQIGRSRMFWEYYYPRLQSVFPDPLGNVSLDQFYRAINRVQPSLIRVESDEVTYNLHIMVRFELENLMLESKVVIKDLPEIWNDKMEEYLGIRPTSNAEGILQDVHWSLGSIGYFPTYALGNLMAAQIFAQAERSISGLKEQIASGQFAPLVDWLRTHIHQFGRKLQASEILERVSGESLDARFWLDYVRQKYQGIYGPLP